MTIELHKTIKAGGTQYNVLLIEQDGIFEYYLQKVGYGDLMHIVGTLEKIELDDDYIIQSISGAIQENFWRD